MPSLEDTITTRLPATVPSGLLGAPRGTLLSQASSNREGHRAALIVHARREVGIDAWPLDERLAFAGGQAAGQLPSPPPEPRVARESA